MMSSQSSRFFFIKSCITVTLLLFIAACSADTKSKQDKPKTVPVLAATAEQKDIPVQLTAIGTVEAYSTVSVRSLVGGTLSQIHFREGQDVGKGAILFTIDPRPFEAALRQAEATMARDAAQMENARQEAKRYEELVKKGYVSRSQYDQFKTNADALEAVVRADMAAVENARLQLGYCSIYAPVSGRAGGLLVNQGNIVKANDDKALVVIHQIQPIYVTLSAPEQNLTEIKRFMAAAKLPVYVSPVEGITAEGTLTFIDNAVDRATGTIKLKATFDNRDRKLWPGQFVNVIMRLAMKHSAVVVPSQSVQTGQQGQFVFVVKPDSTAEARPVTIGVSYKGETVIEKGLAPNETVVIDGHIRIFPGAKVEIKNPSQKEQNKAQTGEQPKAQEKAKEGRS